MGAKDDTDIGVVNAVHNAEKPQDNLITLSTGVVLRGKLPAQLTMIKVMAAYPRPKPPVHFIKAMGREMENADDPDYLEQVKAWKIQSGEVQLNAVILMGTELVEVPKKFPKHTDDSWLEEYSLLGLPIHPENKSWRYLAWVTFLAAKDKDDLDKIKEVVGRLSGIPEKEVEAAETFPGSDDGDRPG
jgi:hypothetical protein